MKYFTIIPINNKNNFLEGCNIKEVDTKVLDGHIRYENGSIDKSLLDERFWDFQFPNLYTTKAKAQKAFRQRIKDHKDSMENRHKEIQKDIKEIQQDIQLCKKLLKLKEE